jgi:predicted amidohydrolase
VTTSDGSLPARWCDAANPYNEKSLLSRALENTVFVAQANVAGPDQGSVTGIIAPDGTLVAALAYGEIGVVAADIDLALANGLMASRWAPDRNVLIATHALEPA